MRYLVIFCLCLFFTHHLSCIALAHTNPLPEEVEASLEELFAALPPSSELPLPAIKTVLDFISQTKPNEEWIFAERFNKSQGVFFQDNINVPLKDVIDYLANPLVPGEAVFPTSVRTNYWVQPSAVRDGANVMLKSPLPPEKPLTFRGTEFEETTPEIASGCYYTYTLDRLMILMPYEDDTVLISVSLMPKPSFIGKKGAILGDDTDLNYIYTPTEGTSLPLLGWAKTQVYTSATVSIYKQDANNPQKTQITLFKWTSAGWNKLNVVEKQPILDGLVRFVNSLKNFLESPNRPEPEEIIEEVQRLNTLNETELFAAMQPYLDFLHKEQANHKILQNKDFKAMLDNNAYPTTFTHAALISDLIKQYTKQQLTTQATPEATPEATP